MGRGGDSPEVHDYLHCFEHVQLQVVRLHQTASSLTPVCKQTRLRPG